MRLSELQSGFRSWLENGSEQFAARLGRDARHGLDVYRNNYRAQLRSCLEAAFPITLEWIGWSAFQDAMAHHVASFHPISWTLDAYPMRFNRTLKERFPADPEVAELALLEWALSQAFVNRDAAPVSIEQLRSADWDHTVLRFSPSFEMNQLTTNAPDIWSALKQGQQPPQPIALAESRILIVWRAGEQSRFRSVDLHEGHALRSAFAGSTFGELCATLASSVGQIAAAESAGQWLGRWIADGLIVGIYDN
jgi:hypothetical protein